jgi:hypothetical protein
MTSRTPPSKRHHLPWSMMTNSTTAKLNKSSNTSSSVGSASGANRRGDNNNSNMQSSCFTGGRLNQIFVITCMAIFSLQLLSSFLSWQQNHHDSIAIARRTTTGRFPLANTDGNGNDRQQRLVDLNPIASYSSTVRGGGGLNRYYLTKKKSANINNNEPPPKIVGRLQQQQLQPSSSLLLEHQQEEQEALEFYPSDNRRYGAPQHSRRLRVLFGIITADFKNDQAYRKRHRMLFELWNDTRVCSLPDFKAKPLSERYECEIIYTFVMAANPDASPELVDESRPFEVQRPIRGGVCTDLNEPDMTLLNIRENMNEGKSQTWMYYGAKIAREYDLDYVTKCDADAILHLHEFFMFAYKHMPPAPYNRNMYIGALRDKAYWPRHETDEERIRFESYFGNVFEGVHLYVAGQMYIMSTDLSHFIGEEALRSNCSYCEGHEDHDISAMAFHAPEPVKLVVVGRPMRFWEHPVKGEPRWRRIWARETARVAGIPFEGKMFMNNSTFDALVKREDKQRRN